MAPRVGFLGLGIMGKQMASLLLKQNVEVCVWNRTASKCAPLVAEGATTAATPAEVVASCDITHAMLADPRGELTQDLRRRFGGPIILNSGFSEQTTFEEVEKLLIDDLADLVAVGRPFLANPDLAERWRTGASLNEPDPATFYGGGAEGYTDYPTLTSA